MGTQALIIIAIREKARLSLDIKQRKEGGSMRGYCPACFAFMLGGGSGLEAHFVVWPLVHGGA